MSAGRRLTVGITMRRQAATGGLRARVAQNRAYLERIVEAGGVPVCIPPLGDEESLLQLLGLCDALILPGGPDIEPRRYGEEARPACKAGDSQLDAADLLLCRHALETDMPLLAICRGQQLLNVACGGTLYQDLRAQGATTAEHDVDDEGLAVHPVRCAPGSRLAAVVGEHPGLVNSVHHQAVRRLGAGLRAVAHSDDGVVEGVERPDRSFVVGVQWHPEDLAPDHPAGAPLVAALVAAARRPAGLR